MPGEGGEIWSRCDPTPSYLHEGGGGGAGGGFRRLSGAMSNGY